jgi:hypothetical protein
MDLVTERNKSLPLGSASKFIRGLCMPKENFLRFLDMFQYAHHLNISGGIFNAVSDADQSVCCLHLVPDYRIILLMIRLLAQDPPDFVYSMWRFICLSGSPRASQGF